MKYRVLPLSLLLITCAPIFADSDSNNMKMDKKVGTQNQPKTDQLTFSENDTRIIRQIRQDIMKEKNFSIYAQNVNITSTNGNVTVKGPVSSMREHNLILKHSRLTAGVSHVKNEMTIKGNKNN